MKYYLLAVLSLYSNLTIFAQDDDDFEVGLEHQTNKVTLLTNNKTATMFLDGILVGKDKAKVKLDSQEPNLLVTTYENGDLFVENLNVQSTPKEYLIQPKPRQKPTKQNSRYFDSLFIETRYEIPNDQFIGWNEKKEIYWRGSTKTLLTTNNRHFSNHQNDYLNLYNIPTGNFGYDSATFDYQLLLRVDDFFVNIQDEYGYVQFSYTATVLDKSNKKLYEKTLFGVSAQKTNLFRFKNAVNECFDMGTITLLNDKKFISAIKRKSKREHKKQESVIVATVTQKKETPNVDTIIIEEGFPSKYMGAVARLKSSKGLFVGFVIAEAGYLLTNKNLVGDAKEIYVKVKGQGTIKGKVIRQGNKTGVVLIQLLSNKKFTYLELAEHSPQKNDTVYSVMPGKKWAYKEGLYQNEVAVFGNFYHTVKLEPGKSTDGTPVLNDKGEVIGILDSKVAGNSKQKVSFIIPIKDALEDLNLKLE
jgi:hypothetical protein